MLHFTSENHMKTKTILCALAFCCPVAFSPLSAQQVGYDFTVDDEPAGYDFTQDDEESKAQQAEMRKKEMQGLIYNGVQYLTACRKAYQQDVVWAVSSCCDGIIGTEDLVDCTKDPVPADLHREAVSKIMGRQPFAADAGQFVEGVLSRSMLAQAKPNLTTQQYTEIEHMITRSENLLKWFLGPFAKACAAHNYDFLKEVQRMERFREYLKTPNVEEHDVNYFAMIDAYAHSYARDRIDKAFSTVDSNPGRFGAEFFNYFHNTLSTEESDAWLSYVVLGGSSRGTYNGPRFGVEGRFMHRGMVNPYTYLDIRGGKVCWASTAEAAELASYMRYFDFWSNTRIDAAEDLAFAARSAVRAAADAFYSGISAEAAQIVVKEDADFKQAVNNRALYALNKLVTMDDAILDFREYLKKNSNFVKNRQRTQANGSLLRCVQARVEQAKQCLRHIQSVADRTVPKNAPSRQTD